MHKTEKTAVAKEFSLRAAIDKSTELRPGLGLTQERIAQNYAPCRLKKKRPNRQTTAISLRNEQIRCLDSNHSHISSLVT